MDGLLKFCRICDTVVELGGEQDDTVVRMVCGLVGHWVTLYCGSLGHGKTLGDTVVWRRGTLGDTGCAPSVKFASSLYMSFCFGGDSPYDKDKFQTSITPGIEISLLLIP